MRKSKKKDFLDNNPNLMKQSSSQIIWTKIPPWLANKKEKEKDINKDIIAKIIKCIHKCVCFPLSCFGKSFCFMYCMCSVKTSCNLDTNAHFSHTVYKEAASKIFACFISIETNGPAFLLFFQIGRRKEQAEASVKTRQQLTNVFSFILLTPSKL